MKLTAAKKFTNEQNFNFTVEEKQNAENERLAALEMVSGQNEFNEMLETTTRTTTRRTAEGNSYKKSYDDDDYDSENGQNENWENWEASCPCAIASNCWWENYRYERRSICFVFMPNEPAPIPVKLRSTKIPGGFTWVSYGGNSPPDADILYANDDVSDGCLTGWQTAQQQQRCASVLT